MGDPSVAQPGPVFHVRIYTSVCTYIYNRMFTDAYIHVNIYIVYIYVHVYIYIYMYMLIYIYI